MPSRIILLSRILCDIASSKNLRAEIDDKSVKTSALLEALIRLYEGPDNFYLNFYGPPGTIPTISYYQVVSGSAVADQSQSIDFRGKTVFVGVSELTKPLKEDSFPTVFGRDDGVDLSGVEIAATAFANMLTGHAVRPVGPGLRPLR